MSGAERRPSRRRRPRRRRGCGRGTASRTPPRRASDSTSSTSSSASSMSSASSPARSKRPSTSPIASFSSTTWSARRLPSRDCRSYRSRDSRNLRNSSALGALETAARELPLELADPVGRFLEAALLALVEPVEDRARPQVALGDGRQDLGVGEAARDAALQRADVVQEARRHEVLELLRPRHVGRELVEGAHDRGRRRRVQPRPDRGGGRGLEELAQVRTRAAATSSSGRALPGGHDRREEVHLVDDVVVDVGLREVEAQEVKGDLLVLRLDLLEEAAHVGRRDVAVGLAQLAAERVEPVRELAEARRDLLGRRRVDRAGHRAHVVVEASEVERVRRLRSRRTSSGRRGETGERSSTP